MISQDAGTTTLLENILGRPLLKHHCTIHQESLCGKNIKFASGYVTSCEMCE